MKDFKAGRLFPHVASYVKHVRFQVLPDTLGQQDLVKFTTSKRQN